MLPVAGEPVNGLKKRSVVPHSIWCGSGNSTIAAVRDRQTTAPPL
jgi:hypothetical protein